MKLLFTVCGRAGSSGVKSKNIRPFLGVPLFEYTLAAISSFIESNKEKYEDIFCVVSTDSENFIEQVKARENKKFYIINRNAELSLNATPKMHVIKDALETVEKKSGQKFDLIIDLDITSPIRTIKDIQDAIDKKIGNVKTDVVFSVTDARRNPYFNMVKQDGLFVTKVIDNSYTARQQAPKVFDMNASIYVYGRSFLLSGVKSPLDGRADIIEMPDTGVLDIDSERDFELMQVIAKWVFDNNIEYRASLQNLKK